MNDTHHENQTYCERYRELYLLVQQAYYDYKYLSLQITVMFRDMLQCYANNLTL